MAQARIPILHVYSPTPNTIATITAKTLTLSHRNTQTPAYIQNLHSYPTAYAYHSQNINIIAGASKIIQYTDSKDTNAAKTYTANKKVHSVAMLNEHDFITSDKFGDVYHFPSGKLLLGHVSQTTALMVSDDYKFIITADRDEKIRVTRYPDTYNIEAFLLGHQNFVYAIAFVEEQKYIVSAGGDTYMILWDWRNAKEVNRIDFHKHIDIDIKDIAVRSIIVNKAEIAMILDRVPFVMYFKLDGETLTFERKVKLPGNPLAQCWIDDTHVCSLDTSEEGCDLPIWPEEQCQLFDLKIESGELTKEESEFSLYPASELRKDTEVEFNEDGQAAVAKEKTLAERRAAKKAKKNTDVL